ncbi:unnamed protein product [Ixodes hexagonus]
MPSTADAKASLATQTEKPNHYNYLKEFRVDQCPLFVQHKCTQHKPFTCFHWHFKNQRRRRPVRAARDGTFNYSPDVYCTSYDETTGICPEGDGCRFLHRTAGDTERRYHLRYYKTGICVYDTDARGNCVKNGPHCAFAHGLHDLRSPVYDAKEQQACLSGDAPSSAANGPEENGAGPNSLDKERNALNEDPHWQAEAKANDTTHEQTCERPITCTRVYLPRYKSLHSLRKTPRFRRYRGFPRGRYRGPDWLPSAGRGEDCSYWSEHPERAPSFPPFLPRTALARSRDSRDGARRSPNLIGRHAREAISIARRIAVGFHKSVGGSKSILFRFKDIKASAFFNSEAFSESIVGEEYRHVGCVELGRDGPGNAAALPIGGRPFYREYLSKLLGASVHAELQEIVSSNSNQERNASIRQQLKAIDNEPMADPLEKARLKQDVWLVHGLTPPAMRGLPFFQPSSTVESVVGNALDDLSLDDINVEASLELDGGDANNPVSSSITQGLASSGLLGSSAPMNIPGSGGMQCNRRAQLSPPSLPHSLSSEHAMDKAAAAFYSQSGSFSGGGKYPFLYEYGGALWEDRLAPKMPPPGMAPPPASWEEGLVQARQVYEAWKREVEEAKHREKLAECQRDEAVAQASLLQKELEALAGGMGPGPLRPQDLDKLGPGQLRLLHERLRSDLDTVEKLLYQQCHPAQKSKCLVCQQQNRSVAAALPCNHLALCGACAAVTPKCPYCSCDIAARSSLPMSL